MSGKPLQSRQDPKPDKQGKSKYLPSTAGPLLGNGLDRRKNRYGRSGIPSFYSISISTVGVDGARVCLWRSSFLALWLVVDISEFPDKEDTSGSRSGKLPVWTPPGHCPFILAPAFFFAASSQVAMRTRTSTQWGPKGECAPVPRTEQEHPNVALPVRDNA